MILSFIVPDPRIIYKQPRFYLRRDETAGASGGFINLAGAK